MNESSKASDHGTPESEEPKIVEPELGAAAISEDVAESVDLAAAEAEAAAVEHEAELAARNASPQLGTPDAGAAAAAAVAAASPVSSPDKPGSTTGAPTVRPPSTAKDPAKGAPKGAPKSSAGTPKSTAGSASVDKAPAASKDGEAGKVPETTPPAAAPDTTADAAGPENATPPADTATRNEQIEAADAAVAGTEKAEAAEAKPAGTDRVQPAAAATVDPPKPLGHISPGVDDGHGWRRPESKWEQSSTPWKPKAGAWQSPAQISRNAADAQAAEALAAKTGGADSGPQPAGTPPTSTRPAETPPAAAQPAKIPAAPPAQTTTPGNAGANAGSSNTKDTSDGNPKKILIVAGIVLVALALLVLFIILLIGFFTGDKTTPAVGSSSPQSSQSLASSVGESDADLVVAAASPLDWLEGDCLRDFKGASAPADVVLCSSPHNAQLVGTFNYEESDKFPGQATLKVKATQVCEAVPYTSDAAALKTLKQTTAYPSEATWNEKNDRRVDCMVHDTRSGNPLDISLTG